MTKQFIVRLKKTDGTIVANSQIITVNGIGSGTILASDFTDGLLTGPVSTTNRSGSFVKTIAAPVLITYSLTANVSSVNEPGTIRWTISASGGTVTYPRTFRAIFTNFSTNLNASDFVVAPGDTNWQEETITLTGASGLTLPFSFNTAIENDAATEGPETFQVSLYSWPGTAGAPTGANTLVTTSSVITINDTSTSPVVTPTPSPGASATPPPSSSPPPPTPSPSPPTPSPPPPTPSPSPPPPTPTPTQSQVVTYGTPGLWSRSYDKYSGLGGGASGSGWGNFAAYAPYPNSIPDIYDATTSSRVSTVSASAVNTITIFTGNFVPDVSGVWTFSGSAGPGAGDQWANDYAGVYFNSPNYGSDNSILRSRTDSGAGDNNNSGATASLTAGTAYAITIMHANGPGSSALDLAVTPPGGTLTTNLSPYFFTNNLPTQTWPGVTGGHGSRPIGEGGALFGVDTSTNSAGPNRVLIGSVRTVTRIQIWIKLQINTYSTTGVSYDTMVHDHGSINYTWPASPTNESILWDSNDSGNAVTDLVGSYFYINRIDSYAFGIHNAESIWYGPNAAGSYVVGHRLKIWTTAMPYGGPPAFETSASSSPFTDYIRQG